MAKTGGFNLCNLVVGVSGRAENFNVFAFVEFLEGAAGGTQIFAGVKFRRLFNKDFTDGSGHGKTAVGVDVDFADSRLGSFAELIFADTDSIFELSAVGVDDGNLILRNAGRTVQNDRESGDALFDFSEDIQTDTGVVARLEFVSTMTGSDSDSQRINTGTFDEVFNFFRTGVGVGFSLDIIFNTGENTELALNGHTVSVGIFDDALGFFDVFFIGQMRSVDHDRRESQIDTAFAGIEVRTVIQVQNDRNALAAGNFFGVLNSTLSHVAQQSLVGVFTGAFGNLKNHRGFGFNASLNDCLELFHVVEVVGGNGIFAGHRLLEEFNGVDQTERFVTDHFFIHPFTVFFMDWETPLII